MYVCKSCGLEGIEPNDEHKLFGKQNCPRCGGQLDWVEPDSEEAIYHPFSAEEVRVIRKIIQEEILKAMKDANS